MDEVDPSRLRRFDQNLVETNGWLEHRVMEPVPHCWMCPQTSAKRAKEHIFPTWLVKHLGAAGEVVAPFRMSLPLGGAVVSQRPEMPIGSVLAGEVCAPCNNGWINQLEAEMRPILKAERRRGVISDNDALSIARWFTKTAIMLNVSQPYRLLFDAPTRHAVADGMPPRVVVTLHRVRETDGAFDWAQTSVQHALLPQPDTEVARRVMAMTYVGYIRVERLVGTIIALPEPLRPGYLTLEARQIWPVTPRRPTWGAIPVFNRYTDPDVGLHLPSDWSSA